MKMKAWNWIELFGFVTVAISLIFVGIQLKQNHEITLASQYQQRSTTVTELNKDNLNRMNERLTVELMNKPFKNSTNDELLYKFFLLAAGLSSLDNCHYQYEKGFMDDDSWHVCKARLEFTFKNCTNQMFWRQSKSNTLKQRESFAFLIDNYQTENCSEQIINTGIRK